MEEDRKCGEGYTRSSNVHITTCMQVVESHNITTEISQPTYFEQLMN